MRSFLASNDIPAREGTAFKGGEPHQSGGLPWRLACAGVVFAAAFACSAQDRHRAVAQAAQPSSSSQASSPANAKPQAEPRANPEAANAHARESSLVPQSSADGQRRKQISAESAQLLAMAVDLKAEMDKTNKNTLSLKVIRKADAIEKLAKAVEEKMKQGSGPS